MMFCFQMRNPWATVAGLFLGALFIRVGKAGVIRNGACIFTVEKKGKTIKKNLSAWLRL